MRNRRTSYLAWGLFAHIALSMVLQATHSLTRPGAGANGLVGFQPLLWSMVMVVFALVAALIIARQPRNVIGWLLMCPAIAAAIPAESYIASYTAASVSGPFPTRDIP
jgi:hypothetical protein